MGAIISDTTTPEPGFVVERFAAVGDRIEVVGQWHGVRGRRFVRPVLWLHGADSRRRLVAVLDHKPWATDEGETWVAAFAWDGGAIDAERAELEVGRELVVELPLPGAKVPASAPARARRPSELERARDELTAATRERRTLQDALDTATAGASELAQVRADSDRLVTDESRRREDAMHAADRSAERARESEAAHALTRRQLAAARTSQVELERRVTVLQARLAELEAERDDARAKATSAAGDRVDLGVERDEARARAVALEAERDEARAAHARLEERLAGATAEHDALQEPPPAAPERDDGDLAAERAEQQRLEGELAGAWADRERLVAELSAARDGRERVEGELVSARSDRKRLERELAEARGEAQAAARRTVRVAPQPFTASRLAPPRSGGGLWLVRLIALAMVAALLAAVALLVTGVF